VRPRRIVLRRLAGIVAAAVTAAPAMAASAGGTRGTHRAGAVRPIHKWPRGAGLSGAWETGMERRQGPGARCRDRSTDALTQAGVTLLNHSVSRAVGLLRSVVVLFGRTVI
jgi:hypothetical protein